MTHTKICTGCHQELPITEFYRNKGLVGGLFSKCKACTRAAVIANRHAKIEYYRAYDSARAKLPHRVVAALKQMRKWRNEDKRRTACHNKVARALRAGTLEWQPCSVCGSEKSMAHHEDYDKPLEVIWYCQVHHKARHKEMALDQDDDD